MPLLWLLSIFFLKTIYTLRAGPYIFANESIGSPVVSTTSGRFVGLTIRQTNVWVGIPYAAPPIGALRWQKAQPYVVNSCEKNTIQDATHYGTACPQITRGFISEPSDEDCLYLNVWAPRKPSRNRAGHPVLFWIHGGGFIQGSSSASIYDGLGWTNTAIEGNNPFIMVSINYRLGVFGYFSQPTLLDKKGRTIANQGITDQRLAMEWIQQNIAQFGGDKNSVTAMGQSAGSFSVCFHLVSPLSAGLFHAAMMQSGPCDNYSLRDKSFAYSATNSLASTFGCNSTNLTQQLACLRAVNSSLLVAAARDNVSAPITISPPFQNLEKISNILPFNPIVDDVEIPVYPLKAFLLGKFHKVPTIIGATRDEFLSNAIYTQFFTAPTSAEDYLTRVLPIVTYNNSELQAAFAPSQFNGNYTQAYIALLSQRIFICGSRRIAGYMSSSRTFLYTYTHTYETPVLNSPVFTIWPGAYHLAELFSLFQTLSSSFNGNSLFKPDELPLVTSLRRYWTNMATNHQPNDNTSLTWPQYSSATDQVLVLDNNITSRTFTKIYPYCDLLADMEIKVFSKSLGFDATCLPGNKCFIISSPPTSTTTKSTKSPKHRMERLFESLLRN